MSILRKLVAVLLVACMALSLAGCGDTTWIMKADDIVLNSGLYIYYQTQGYYEAVMTLAQQDMNYYYAYMYGQSLLEEKLNDGTVEDYTNQYAIDMCRQYVVVEHLFNELGLEVSAEDEALIKAQVRNTWNDSKESLESIGISESTLRKVITSRIKEDLVFEAYYEVGGIKGTTEETIKDHLSDDYARIKFMTFNFAESIEDAIDEAVKNEQLALAQSYLDRANAGEDMNTLIEEYNAYLESLKEEETTDEETADNETADETVEAETEDEEADPYLNETLLHVDGTYPSEKFVGYVFNNCKVGEYSLIQDDINFYLVQRLDILERNDIYENYRDSLIAEIYDSDYTKLINETLAKYDIDINEKSVKRYTAKNAIEGRGDDKTK